MPDRIVLVQAFAELRYGVVVHTRENSVKYGLNFNQTPYVSNKLQAVSYTHLTLPTILRV